MNERSDENGCCPEAMSFADGEACDEVRMRVLGKMAEDGEVAKQVRHQVQLKDAVRGAMVDGKSCVCPEDLKAKLVGMFDDAEAEGDYSGDRGDEGGDEQRNRMVIGRIGRWMPSAAAALIMFAVVMSAYDVYRNGGASGDGPMVAGIMPMQMVNLLEKRHVGCAVDIARLPQDPQLPRKVEALPNALNERFGSRTSGLDLSGIGYEFDRVGKCTAPGEISVHLIYKPIEGSLNEDMISLWIVPNVRNLKLDEGRVYTINDKEKAHPMLVWREGEMLYYMVGDSMERTIKAADSLVEQWSKE